MPKRTDIKRVLVIGSGPIVIGQASEFDYSGTQACKALRAEGLEVILVNSNPASIMTDPDISDRTYVELIGAQIDAIVLAEDRLQFRDAMREIGADVPESRYVGNMEEAFAAAEVLGFPIIIRPSFTLGGVGGGIAYNIEEFRELAGRGIDLSPVHEVLVEQSVIGWKEFELEVMRDRADNFVVICSIENVDPMGVHTGDSITVAPALTLTDKECQRMRDLARRIIRRVGVETGGSNIQFAINPANGRMLVIEMNPRVSRSSALASKATGFPIAKIAAKLAVGYTLDEIPNDITEQTPASFEPTLDYVVVKAPRFAFEKFPSADATLTTTMKSVGEAMAIGRNFTEAFQKALRSLEKKGSQFTFVGEPGDKDELLREAVRPTDGRINTVMQAIRAGATQEEVFEYTKIDPWFVDQLFLIKEIADELAEAPELTRDLLAQTKRHGFSDQQIGEIRGLREDVVREVRHARGVRPVYKTFDTWAAEFAAKTPYFYSSYDEESEVAPREKPAVIILGSGPNRIGQGIEFDYSCVHASFALSDAGY